MSFPQSRETQRASKGCAPGTPAGAKTQIGRITFAGYCSPAIVFFLGRSLRIPSGQRPWCGASP